MIHKNSDNSREMISVIMPVYRSNEKMLHAAVKSILVQEYDRFELIIVEDPSPETSREVIEGFKDARIRYVLNKKRGSFAHQLNLSLKVCQGDLVARMDSDDMSEPNRLLLQHQFMSQHPHISVVGTNLTITNSFGAVLGRRIYPEKPEEIAREMRLGNAVAHPSVMFRKGHILEMGGYRVEFGPVADYDLWCRLVLAGRMFYNIQEPLVRYRLHKQATKMAHLKETLQATVEIKKRHFRERKRKWGPREEFRFNLEKLLMFFPAALVFRLFKAATVKRSVSP